MSIKTTIDRQQLPGACKNEVTSECQAWGGIVEHFVKHLGANIRALINRMLYSDPWGGTIEEKLVHRKLMRFACKTYENILSDFFFIFFFIKIAWSQCSLVDELTSAVYFVHYP